jgi:hypothetical protein
MAIWPKWVEEHSDDPVCPADALKAVIAKLRGGSHDNA